jgi:hypothetical protein
VATQHLREGDLVVAVDDVTGGPGLALVHAHVERRIVAVREPAVGAVQLRRADAEVEQGAAEVID